MANSSARIQTKSASRYLQQLCKHWSHKFEVTFDATHGRIPLPIGVAILDATPETLDVRVEAADAETLPRLKEVVANHLDRFAFREAPLPFDWKDAA